MKEQTISFKLPIHILCAHPLVFRIIQRILTPSAYRIHSFSPTQINGRAEHECILIIDTCSVESWLETTLRYGLMKKQPVILLIENLSPQDEIRVLHLGVRGIVPIANLEKQIMACLVEGFSNKEIGQTLGISPRTVKFHVTNILHKFNIKNRRHLQVTQYFPKPEPLIKAIA
jgi:DNA-binding CsgD family transcriptional regulator